MELSALREALGALATGKAATLITDPTLSRLDRPCGDSGAVCTWSGGHATSIVGLTLPFAEATPISQRRSPQRRNAREGRSMNRHFTPLDWVVLVTYFLGTMSIGFYFWRKSHSPESFTAAGRSLPGWVCGLSIFATYLSSISSLALPGK
jgi:hypothetical protein